MYASILGIVQGITEFFPVSSSGHLLLLHQWLPVSANSELAFDVALHLGTFFAMVIFFGKDIIHYFRTIPKLLGYFILGSIPAGLVGFLFEDSIEQVLRSPWVVVVMLIAVAGIFFVVERLPKLHGTVTQLTWWQAMLIGSAQAVALIPGTSRSGITMSAAMALGYERVTAARLSFLLALPITAGAGAQQTVRLAQAHLTNHELLIIMVGTTVSFVVGLVVIRYLLKFFQRWSLRPFAWYRIALGVVVAGLLLV